MTKPMNAPVIDVSAEAHHEPPPQMAVAVRNEGGGPVDRPITMDELKQNLDFIRQVMGTVMKEGQDYGKVPGCGDKPTLLQPGAQKLLMTFQLTNEVAQETIKDYPGFHREYSFVVRLVSRTGRHWDGVGTCSTLENKYRFRKAEIKCPKCGRTTIIAGKAEYGGGWICFSKKGGCGAKFQANDPAILNQPRGQTENPNPAECWNTVRKMAFKRALVHAAINATNTSELWTQDIEDMSLGQDEDAVPSPAPAPAPAPRPTPAPAPAKAKQEPPLPTVEGRMKMIRELKAGPGEPNREIVTEYFRKAGMLLPNETVEELPLRWVPATVRQMGQLAAAITAFSNGDPANPAFLANPEPPQPKAPPAQPQAPAQSEPEPVPPSKSGRPWFMDVIVPVPRKGMKRDAYLKAPDTIGSLYDLRRLENDEGQEARQRLWGFVTHFEPKGWLKKDGTEMPPNETDLNFRKALDAFAEWFKTNHPDEKL